ncbi:hypothetical protein GCM10007856_26040 [Azospirillum oryzae]|nr:hypothetical protein GCM10007856_26040 [Azospirillum oryzae]
MPEVTLARLQVQFMCPPAFQPSDRCQREGSKEPDVSLKLPPTWLNRESASAGPPPEKRELASKAARPAPIRAVTRPLVRPPSSVAILRMAVPPAAAGPT